MGYAHGTIWTEDKIIQDIHDVMNVLEIKRMPSKKEIETVKGNDALVSKISKTGGFYGWAKKLNLQIKNSETSLGKEYEGNLKKYLQCKGYKVEQMSVKHPYDLLVNENIKIDVKVSRRYYYTDKGYYYTFNLEKRNPTCDIYVCICISQEKIEKILVIPSKFVKLTQLSIGDKSSYDKYKDRWDYLKTYDKFYKKLC